MPLDSGLGSGVSALKAGTQKMEIIGNNIANLESIAFKSGNMLQTDNFYQALQQSAASSGGTGSNTAAFQVGSGTQTGSIYNNYNKGNARASSEDSHFAIDGKGWFKVVNSLSGESFATRNGSFRVDDNKQFVAQDGYRLQGAVYDATEEPTYTVTWNAANSELVYTKDTPPGTPAAPVIGSLDLGYSLTVGSGLTRDAGVPVGVTDDEIAQQAPRLSAYSVNKKGEVKITLSNGDSFDRGQVLLMSFADEQALMNEGRGLYTGFAAAGESVFTYAGSKPGNGGLGAVLQRRLEASNVDLTEEFAKIIGTQKYIQAAARIITTASEVLQSVVDIKR